MIRAVIFDLDGVLVDTARYHFLAWSSIAKELNIPFTEYDNEQLKGVSRMESLNVLLSLGNVKLKESEKEKLAAHKNKLFVDYINAMSPSEIFPGVETLIKKLKSEGYKIALGSVSKNANAVLEVLKIAGLFDVVVNGSMLKNSKPDPEVFLLASGMLNIPPHECIVVEDAIAGVEAALAAGMKCIGISRHKLDKAHVVLKNTGDINLTIIKNL